MNHYSGPETALMEGEEDCTPHVVRILEGIQQRYGVSCVVGNSKFQTCRLSFPFKGLQS